MIFNVILIICTLPYTCKSVKPVSMGEENLPIGITLFSDLSFESARNVMQNASYSCYVKIPADYCIKINCNSTVGPPIQWLFPRPLREAEQTHDDTRVTMNHTSGLWTNNFENYTLSSSLNIRDLGLIHNGTYGCGYGTFGKVQFNLKIDGGDSNTRCHYNDQCFSENCKSGNCVCDKTSPVYVNGICVGAKSINASCQYDEQCQHKQSVNSAMCDNGLCKCKSNYVPVSIAMSGKLCFKKAQLSESCDYSDQCETKNSFCSLKLQCDCDDGYYSIGTQCVPHQKCNSSVLKENYAMERGECRDRHAFCKDNICLCRPQYVLSKDNECQSRSEYNISNDWISKYGVYIVAAMVALIIFIGIYVICDCVNRRKKMTIEITRSEATSRDALNRW